MRTPASINDHVKAQAEGTLVPKGCQSITDLSSATSLTVPAGAVYALIQPQTQAVRWRDDGVNPTASVGFKVAADDSMYYVADLSAIRFIQVTAGAALFVAYYGYSYDRD